MSNRTYVRRAGGATCSESASGGWGVGSGTTVLFTDSFAGGYDSFASKTTCSRATTEALSDAILLGHGSIARQSSGLELMKGGGYLEKSTFRVLVVDDYEPWQAFVSNTFRSAPELEIVGKVSDGFEAVHKAEELQPDLILLDIGLPTLNGIEVARRISKVSPTCKILFVSENRSADVAQEALSTGAGGYLVKSDAGSELFPAVRAVLEGRRFVSASLAGQFLVATSLSTAQTMLSLTVMLISCVR